MSEESNEESTKSLSRRSMLSMVGTGATIAIAGCTDGSGSSASGGSDENYLGEAQTHDGVRLAVSNYETADQYIDYDADEVVEFEDDDFETPPTFGAEFIFIGVVVDNVSDGNRPFPSDEQFILEHNNDQMEQFTPRNRFFTTDNSNEYVSYTAVIDEEEARDQGTFPGVTVRAWLIFEVPEGFNPNDLKLIATIGEGDGGTDEVWNIVSRP